MRGRPLVPNPWHSLSSGGVLKIRLVSHASVVITSGDTKIWTDPWLVGKAFNNSWTLWPAPVSSAGLLEGVEYLWISHEHPDHLNFPTLAALPADFREHVTLLFQDNHPERIFAPLRQLHFRKFQVLSHRSITQLSARTSIYCYRVGTLDSCLGVMSDGHTALNLNDARLNPADYARILHDIGPADAVLNQFSVAVKDSVVDYQRHARAAAQHVLQSVAADHRGLRAKVTVPFASFMYFSSIDNAHMNAFNNTPRDVLDFCRDRGQEVVVLYPGDEYTVSQPHDSSVALTRYEAAYAKLRSVAYDTPVVVRLSQLAEAFRDLSQNLRARYPQFLLRRLHPLHIRIPDLEATVKLTLATGALSQTDTNAPPGVEIYSQPLHYCLTQPWGMGTLTNSGRFTLLCDERNWKAHKALFALNNAGVYLRPRYLLRRQNWGYLKDRLNGMMRYTERTRAQVRQRLLPALRQRA
jgi:UDP-MurNAc hydroxylase